MMAVMSVESGWQPRRGVGAGVVQLVLCQAVNEAEISAAEIGQTEICAVEIREMQIRVGQIHPAQICAAKVRFTQAG